MLFVIHGLAFASEKNWNFWKKLHLDFVSENNYCKCHNKRYGHNYFFEVFFEQKKCSLECSFFWSAMQINTPRNHKSNASPTRKKFSQFFVQNFAKKDSYDRIANYDTSSTRINTRLSRTNERKLYLLFILIVCTFMHCLVVQKEF